MPAPTHRQRERSTCQTATMVDLGTLVVLRGNLGSGKSTVARMIQERLPRATCLLVSQDRVRREMLNEPDIRGAANIDLIETIASWGLQRGMVVIVEGILNARRYSAMLERLRGHTPRPFFFAWDLDFEETARRHGERLKRVSFTVEDMAEWYHGWQPLEFVDEVRFDASISADDATQAIINLILDSNHVQCEEAIAREER